MSGVRDAFEPEKQLAKRGELSKKEVSEIIKTLESEIRVKMEAALLMQGIVRWSTMSPSLILRNSTDSPVRLLCELPV